MAANGKSQTKSSTDALVCPECGRQFTRPAALGAHRRRAHGVTGQTAAARAARKRGNARRRRGAVASSSAGATGSARGDSRRTRGAVNRDALLQALFPNGIPARESVVAALNSWLDEAERLATLR